MPITMTVRGPNNYLEEKLIVRFMTLNIMSKEKLLPFDSRASIPLMFDSDFDKIKYKNSLLL